MRWATWAESVGTLRSAPLSEGRKRNRIGRIAKGRTHPRRSSRRIDCLRAASSRTLCVSAIAPTLYSRGAADRLCKRIVFSRSCRTAQVPKLMDRCPMSIADNRTAATTGNWRIVCGGGKSWLGKKRARRRSCCARKVLS
eukprot:scaffold170769_cov28-Tisochrysis_lutea.AAC.6